MENEKIKFDCRQCPSFKKSIFSDLSSSEVNELGLHKVPIKLKSGSTLFYQGNSSHGVHCVAEGKLKLTTLTDDGRESIKNLVKEGDLIGYRNVFEKNDYSFSAESITDSQVCHIDKDFFKELSLRKNTLTQNLILKLCEEINKSEKKESLILYKNVKVRISQLLLQLVKDFGIYENGSLKINLNLNRTEMASMIGIAGETLIRFLTELKEKGIIKQRAKNIYIIHSKELERLAED